MVLVVVVVVVVSSSSHILVSRWLKWAGHVDRMEGEWLIESGCAQSGG